MFSLACNMALFIPTSPTSPAYGVLLLGPSLEVSGFQRNVGSGTSFYGVVVHTDSHPFIKENRDILLLFCFLSYLYSVK